MSKIKTTKLLFSSIAIVSVSLVFIFSLVLSKDKHERQISTEEVILKQEKDTIKTLSVEGNYFPINSARELYDLSELVIVAEPVDDFLNRSHVNFYSDDNNLEDYYTETIVNVKQIIKKPENLDVFENIELTIVEPSVGLIENSKKEKIKIVTDGYSELKKMRII